MDAISYTECRANLASTMNRVCDDHSPVIVTRQKASPVVIVSLEDWEAHQETLYLLGNRNTAKRLLESIDQLDQGKGRIRELLDA